MMSVARLLTITCLALGMAGIRMPPAHASTNQSLVVTECTSETGSGGALGIGDAVARANGDSGDTITFSCSGTIPLTSTMPIVSSMTIDGSGQSVVLDGGHSTSVGIQIFEVSAGMSLTLSHLSLQNGFAGFGGAIYNSGAITISNSTLSGNAAAYYGGAIYNGGTLTVTTSTLSGNSTMHKGGAIYNNGTLTLATSTVSGNSSGYGGAIDNERGGTVSITNSTFSGDLAAYGGGIFNAGTAALVDSTLAGNSATFGGGAINNRTGGTLQVGGSIIAHSPSGGNCLNVATITDLGYNLEDTSPSTCGFSAANHDLVGSDPQFVLDSNGNPLLANNGGPTPTIALQQGSPAIDTNSCAFKDANSTTITTDQRGNPRPDGSGESACDIGAYESSYLAGTTVTLASSANPSVYGQSVTFTASVAAGVSGPGAPTGTVQFVVDGSPVGSPVSINGSGQTTITTSTLAPGVHTITATYSGNSTFQGSSGSLPGGQVVLQSPAITSGSSTAFQAGAPDAYTVTSTGFPTPSLSESGGLPTGVSFVDNHNGTASLAGTPGAGTAGVYHFVITASNGVGVPATQSFTLTVLVASTTTSLISSATPSLLHQAVTFTATVSWTGGVPTGSVTFQVDGLTVATVPLDGSGKASFTTSTLGLGSHTITASYSGSSLSSGSSASLIQQVGYGICPIQLPFQGVRNGHIKIKLQLCDTAGTDLSSPYITLMVTGVSPSPGEPPPSGTFSYIPLLGGRNGGYQYSVNTTGYRAGTYQLLFVVSGDPVAHQVSFTVI